MMMNNLMVPQYIHACHCGAELRNNLRNQSMECSKCSSSLTREHRLEVELAARTFLEIALDADIEGVQLGQTIFEIDEAAMPTGLLPFIVDRAAQTSMVLMPEKAFYFRVGEYETTDLEISSTHLYAAVNPDSDMSVKEALLVISHTVKRLIQMSRISDPTNAYINDLRMMTLTELAEGFSHAAH
ncbi:hypothetical protein [Neptuniibacter halophilus]|uniref:hypothetical protein n=1 Tax=Neptuniibacter halophilus TaxID=651666 RepID=UPI0025748902|nr:hypothetical protein [Neptuniibacter halophilus]